MNLKKTTLNIFLVLVTSFSFSQEISFEQKKQKIEYQIKQNLWDEILITAPDLIIEDPTKGDGYYYTSMAFFKLGNKDKALKYIEKATLFADEELSKKINSLKSNFEAQDQVKVYIKNAQHYEAQGETALEANEWLSAWKLDKKNTEMALNAVDLFIDMNEYEKAIEILNSPELSNDPETKELLDKINHTPKMIKINGYNNSMKLGDNYFNTNNFEQAKAYYEKALSYQNYDQDALNKIEKTKEEIVWQKAQKSNYVEDIEKYVDTYPIGKYSKDANDIIKRSYNVIAEKFYLEKNQTRLEEFYQKHLNRFRSEYEAKTIKNLLEKFYFEKAESEYLLKNWSVAKDYYTKYIILSPLGSNANASKKRIKKSQRKMNQTDADFFLYTYDVQSPIGISFGDLYRDNLGYYINFKMNGDIFKGLNVLYKIDNQGVSDSPWDMKTTGKTVDGNISLSGGATFKLAYPLWGYVGIGLGYYPKYVEVDEFLSNGDFYETVWMKNTDESKFSINPEAGLKLKLGESLVLKYGVKYQKEIIHQFGLGFQF